MKAFSRSPYWRLLDTIGGIALGVLLCLGVQSWHTGVSATAMTVPPKSWQAGPWPGCTLLAMSQADVTDGQATVSHQVSATWVCGQPLPPTLMTPSATSPTPTAR